MKLLGAVMYVVPPQVTDKLDCACCIAKGIYEDKVQSAIAI